MMSIHSYVCVAHNLTEERESKCQALWGEYKALLREYPFQRNSSHGEGVREKRGGGGGEVHFEKTSMLRHIYMRTHILIVC